MNIIENPLIGDNMTTENIKRFLDSIRNPQNTYKTIHIGGSNGKGTTSFFLYQMIKQTGLKVGLYISPYTIKRFDNIYYDHRTLDDMEQLFQTYEKEMQACELTPFEMDTALMYVYFHLKQVDYVVVEVGLGGRDDATNVIIPELAIITSISLEHTEILGNTMEAIIQVKSGIFKSGKKVLISPFLNEEAYTLCRHYANIHQSILLEDDFTRLEPFDVVYMNQNLMVSYQAFKYLFPSLKVDVSTLKTLPYRFERVGSNIILDGAHNLEGIQALTRTIERKKMLPIIIFSAIKTKPIIDMIETLKPYAKQMYVMTFDHPDAYEVAFLKSIEGTQFLDFKNLVNTLNHHSYDTILITGSLYFLRFLDPYIRSIHDESKLN